MKLMSLVFSGAICAPFLSIGVSAQTDSVEGAANSISVAAPQGDPVAGTFVVPRSPKGVFVIFGDTNSAPTNIKTLSDIQTLIEEHTAFSGVMVFANWNLLNPNAPTSEELPKPLDCSKPATYTSTDPYDWTFLDSVFCLATSSSPPKTVYLTVTPGFSTPQWVMDEINTNSCEGKFKFYSEPYLVPPNKISLPPDPTPTCHLASFPNLEIPGKPVYIGTPPVLQVSYGPMPLFWDSTYKSAWETFLRALNARYGKNPSFVAIAIGGPTSWTDEMLFPGSPADIAEWSTILKNQFSDPKYWDSDQIFIEEWERAIDMYGEIFSGTTLVFTMAGGPPDFPVPYRLPPGAEPYCAGMKTMNCGAVYSVLSYFEQPGIGGPNARAVEQDGLHAEPETWLGLPAVKRVAEDTAQSTRILGGNEFALKVDGTFPGFGDLCPDDLSDTAACTPEQGFYNTLAEFFDGTGAADLFPRLYNTSVGDDYPGLKGGTKTGPAPLNYLEVFYFDITEAQASGVIETGEMVNPTQTYSAQDMLVLASEGLDRISEQPMAVCLGTCRPPGDFR